MRFGLATGGGSETQAAESFLIWPTRDADANGAVSRTPTLGLSHPRNAAACPDFQGTSRGADPDSGPTSCLARACALCTHSVAELRQKVAVEHEQVKQKDHAPRASYGYGGRFGVEKDRMDKVYVASFERLAMAFPEFWGFSPSSRWRWGTTTLRKWISTPPRKMRRRGSEGNLAWRKTAWTRWEGGLCKRLHGCGFGVWENAPALPPVRRGLWVQGRGGATHVSERSTRRSAD